MMAQQHTYEIYVRLRRVTPGSSNIKSHEFVGTRSAARDFALAVKADTPNAESVSYGRCDCGMSGRERGKMTDV